MPAKAGIHTDLRPGLYGLQPQFILSFAEGLG